jgi:hypothetical protein
LPLLEGQRHDQKILLTVSILASENPTDLTCLEAVALLDTGSTVSGLGPKVISELGLESYGKRLLGSATDLRMVDYFIFRIGLFGRADAKIPYVFPELDGFGWPEPKRFDVILGMDVLSQCDFRMNRAGQWQLAFG